MKLSPLKAFAVLNIICQFSLLASCEEYCGPLAIIGGQGSAPYAAHIEMNGTVKTLPGLPPTGLTYRVAINKEGVGLIGGTNGVNAYAAIVNPDGTLASVSGLIAPGEIYTVSINQLSYGLVGGGHLASNTPFAAIVYPDASSQAIIGLPPNGLIYGVAIGRDGNGIIGGIGPSNSAYAALVSFAGKLTPLTGLPAQGAIFWTSINKSGTSFIGGQDGTTAYAAYVNSAGVVLPVAGLPAGQIYSAGINKSSQAIIGGTSSGVPYAALVSSPSAVKAVEGLPSTAGIIYNVAINDSGTGLLAGYSATEPFGAFVTPDGVLKPLKHLPSGPGFLDGAALDASGVAIVGGISAGAPFAALVAPNGTLTYLNGLPATGEINSIAIAVLDNLVPKAIGSYDSVANTQFLLSETLTQHRLHNPSACEDKCVTWIAPFGSFVRQTKQQSLPDYRNQIAGVLLGVEYCYRPELILGGGVSYAYNAVHFSRFNGNAKINQATAVVYASVDKPEFFMNIALWGGAYQSKNKRISLQTIVSKANPDGWTLSPHIELSKCIEFASCQNYAFEPYAMVDWSNNWQTHYHEKGVSGFNISLDDHCISILRNELGLRFYETFQYCWGQVVFEEKIGYVNRTSIGRNIHRATFDESFSSFNVRTLSTAGQNHAVAAFHIECLPSISANFSASLDYQGEFGTTFQSESLIATLSTTF